MKSIIAPQTTVMKLGKVSQTTLGYIMGKAIEGGATRALPFVRGS